MGKILVSSGVFDLQVLGIVRQPQLALRSSHVYSMLGSLFSREDGRRRVAMLVTYRHFDCCCESKCREVLGAVVLESGRVKGSGVAGQISQYAG